MGVAGNAIGDILQPLTDANLSKYQRMPISTIPEKMAGGVIVDIKKKMGLVHVLTYRQMVI